MSAGATSSPPFRPPSFFVIRCRFSGSDLAIGHTVTLPKCLSVQCQHFIGRLFIAFSFLAWITCPGFFFDGGTVELGVSNRSIPSGTIGNLGASRRRCSSWLRCLSRSLFHRAQTYFTSRATSGEMRLRAPMRRLMTATTSASWSFRPNLMRQRCSIFMTRTGSAVLAHLSWDFLFFVRMTVLRSRSSSSMG